MFPLFKKRKEEDKDDDNINYDDGKSIKRLPPHTRKVTLIKYEGWNFNSGNYLFTTDTK